MYMTMESNLKVFSMRREPQKRNMFCKYVQGAVFPDWSRIGHP